MEIIGRRRSRGVCLDVSRNSPMAVSQAIAHQKNHFTKLENIHCIYICIYIYGLHDARVPCLIEGIFYGMFPN